MKIKNQIYLISYTLIGILYFISSSCTEKDNNNDTTPIPGTIADIDGNIYHTVTICSKLWIVENLKTTRFNDGELIPLVTDSLKWDTLTSPGFCWYKNDANAYKNTYGALYNWYAVYSGKLAPKGWHIPSIIEWDRMISCIGRDSAAGDKLKETGTIHWQSPNYGATNEFGFNALPAGIRGTLGSFSGLRTTTYWWSSSGYVLSNAWYVSLYYLHSYPQLNICNLQPGFSVRCVKD